MDPLEQLLLHRKKSLWSTYYVFIVESKSILIWYYLNSLKSTSFDARDELKAAMILTEEKSKPTNHDHVTMTSKKIHRMHFIGSYNFLKSEEFVQEDHWEHEHQIHHRGDSF